MHLILGRALDKLNRFEDVVVGEMEEVIRLDPKHANALNYLGYSYADRGVKLPEAVDLIRKALEVKPDDGYYLDSLGWAYYKLGRPDEALSELQRAATFVSDDAVIHEHLGDVYFQKNMKAEAKKSGSDLWIWIPRMKSSGNNLKKQGLAIRAHNLLLTIRMSRRRCCHSRTRRCLVLRGL